MKKRKPWGSTHRTWLTSTQAAYLLGESLSTLFYLEKIGEVRSTRIGGGPKRYEREAIEVLKAKRNLKEYLNGAQTAQFLEVTYYKVKLWVKSGELVPEMTDDGHRRFKRKDVEAFNAKRLGGTLQMVILAEQGARELIRESYPKKMAYEVTFVASQSEALFEARRKQASRLVIFSAEDSFDQNNVAFRKLLKALPHLKVYDWERGNLSESDIF